MKKSSFHSYRIDGSIMGKGFKKRTGKLVGFRKLFGGIRDVT